MTFYALFNRIMKKKSFCGGVPLISQFSFINTIQWFFSRPLPKAGRELQTEFDTRREGGGPLAKNHWAVRLCTCFVCFEGPLEPWKKPHLVPIKQKTLFHHIKWTLGNSGKGPIKRIHLWKHCTGHGKVYGLRGRPCNTQRQKLIGVTDSVLPGLSARTKLSVPQLGGSSLSDLRRSANQRVRWCLTGNIGVGYSGAGAR